MSGFLFVLLIGALQLPWAQAEVPENAPWPFPWAVDCAVNWEKLNGQYVILDNDDESNDWVQVLVIPTTGVRKIIKVTTYSARGEKLAEGFTRIKPDDKTARFDLISRVQRGKSSAVLKVFYASKSESCRDENLLPILAVEPDDAAKDAVYYRLVRKGHAQQN